jgi:hypothetical protein
VGHGKIRVAKSLREGYDELGKLEFGYAFIKGIDNKRQRWTPAQSESKFPEGLKKESLHLVAERRVWV